MKIQFTDVDAYVEELRKDQDLIERGITDIRGGHIEDTKPPAA